MILRGKANEHMAQSYAEARVDVIRAMISVKPRSNAMIRKMLRYLQKSIELSQHDFAFYIEKYAALKPLLLILASKDQEAYNMVRWLRHETMNEILEGPRTQFFHVEKLDAGDPLAPCAWFSMRFEHFVALILLKIRLLLDLRRLVVAAQVLSPLLPAEISDQVRTHIPWTSRIRRDLQLTRAAPGEISWTVLQTRIRDLEAEILRMTTNIAAEHEGILVGILDPSEVVKSRPYSKLAEDLPVRLSHEAWIQTPGALEAMRDFASRIGHGPTPPFLP